MNVMILGGDGYLGWPTAMYLSRHGHKIMVVDNFAKRQWEKELGIESLIPIRTLQERVKAWKEISGHSIEMQVGDLTNFPFVEYVMDRFRPDAIVHFGEQPSAPYSMMDRDHCIFTQMNNIVGTLNVLYAMRSAAPQCHLIKLGTMGEYGTPNIDIEEGFIEIEHHGRKDILPFPKQPGSFYHLSKVHDSHNIMFACRVWGIRSTDLHQGIVYGIETDETVLSEHLATNFHYDDVFGTVLNRFCAQSIMGVPLTVYGEGGQTRGFLNIRDTLQCIRLNVEHPASEGEYRVFNQFTEQFNVLQLAQLVKKQAEQLNIPVQIQHIENPRVEKEEHYFNARHQKLMDLGLVPHYLSDELVRSMLFTIRGCQHRINRDLVQPRVYWNVSQETRSFAMGI
jgi:UDP-sulfoquinovose synthase